VYLIAVALHTAWDSAADSLIYLVIALISLTGLWVSAHRLAAPERRPHLSHHGAG
jgi:RsiW-degrading membrane proteinase PrsW (M82 family)